MEFRREKKKKKNHKIKFKTFEIWVFEGAKMKIKNDNDKGDIKIISSF